MFKRPGSKPSDQSDRLATLEAAVAALQEALRAVHTAMPQPYDDAPVRDVLQSHDSQLDELTLAIDEGIRRVDRSERRIQQVVFRAREKLARDGYEDPGLEAEVAQLELGDGERGGGRGVPPMSAPVEGRRLDVSAFPGRITEDEIARLMEGRG